MHTREDTECLVGSFSYSSVLFRVPSCWDLMGVALCHHVCDQEYDQGAVLRSPLHSYSRTYVHQ